MAGYQLGVVDGPMMVDLAPALIAAAGEHAAGADRRRHGEAVDAELAALAASDDDRIAEVEPTMSMSQIERSSSAERWLKAKQSYRFLCGRARQHG